MDNCKPYFDYDQVVYFHNPVSSDGIFDVVTKENKTPKEKAFVEMMIDDTFSVMADTAQILNLKEMGFKESVVPSTEFASLDSIFCERKHESWLATSCIPEYRDILVFKKKHKIVGVAKICLECMKSVISGTKRNTDQFGQSGDYDKLSILLHGKSVVLSGRIGSE